MTQPPLFDAEPRYHDLWGGRRLNKEEFEHLFNDDPHTIRGIDAITGVGEYKPGGADEDNWYTKNPSYTNDQMYRDMNRVLRIYRGRLPWDDPGQMARIHRGESAVFKDVHSDPEEIQDVIDHMDYGHTHSRMHGLTALHRGIKDTRATFGEAADGDLTGHTFVEHAPMSTSPSDVVARDFTYGRYGGGEPAHIHILAPKGTPAMSTMWHGDKEGGDIHTGESEVILGRGGRYHVVHDEQGPYRRKIYLQYLGPDTTIHGKADLDNLEHHDPSQRFDLGMDRLREHTARQATGDDFDRYMKAGYEYEVEPNHEFDQAKVTFTKPYYDRGIHHTVEYNDVTEHEWPTDIESTIRPIRDTRNDDSPPVITRPSEVEYLDQDGGSVFHQAQKHLNRHPDSSYFFRPYKEASLLALAGSNTWED